MLAKDGQDILDCKIYEFLLRLQEVYDVSGMHVKKSL